MSNTTALPTGIWHLEPSTTITTTVKKMGVITVPATLDLVSSTIEINADHEIVSVDVVADASSYASKNAKRNEHVVGEDFLDAAVHPTISFRADTVTADGSNYRAKGSVTVKGRTSPVDVTIADVNFTDTTGSFTASATIDRKTIGVDRMPTFIIGRELALSVTAKAAKTT